MKLASLPFALVLVSACSSREPAAGGAPGVVTVPATPTAAPAGAPAAAGQGSAALGVEVTEGACKTGSDGPITTLRASQSGGDVRVEVTGYQTYCTSDSTYAAVDEAGTVHITASKPTTVSRCMCPHSLTMTVHGVKAGEHRVVFDAVQYASADSAVRTIATGSVSVR